MPAVIQPDVTFLNLRFHALARIEQLSFQGLSQISKLFLDTNKIYLIDDSCFVPCPALGILSIAANKIIIHVHPELGSLANLDYFVAYKNEQYVPMDNLYVNSTMTFLVLVDCNLKYVPQLSDSSPIEFLSMLRNPILTAPDLSKKQNLACLRIETESLLCDMRLCWLLFEPFDPTTQQSVISPVTGSTFGPKNDLDLATFGCHNLPYTGIPLRDINPLELKCYDSKLCQRKFSQIFFHVRITFVCFKHRRDTCNETRKRFTKSV